MSANMKKTLVKICGIKNTALLTNMGELGVDFIGIVFHPASKRYVDIETAKKIAFTAKENHISPVAVFVNQTAREIEEICAYTDITTVQLHGEQCKKQHYLLPDHYKRIYVQNVD